MSPSIANTKARNADTPEDSGHRECAQVPENRKLSLKKSRLSLQNHSAFQDPIWDPRNSNSRRNESRTSKTTASSRKLSSTAHSPGSGSPLPFSKLGSARSPIDLMEDGGNNMSSAMGVSRNTDECRSFGSSYSTVGDIRGPRYQSVIDLDDEEGPSALSRSIRRQPTAQDVLIDLDCFEAYDVDGLCEVDVYVEGRKQSTHQKSSKFAKIMTRNSTIALPLTSIESYSHEKYELRKNKTVELIDGDFLRIKHIIRDSSSGEVKLRGHRIQRVKDLNGMLPRKVNEVLLFHEIDLDDARDPQEQSAVEVPVKEVVKLRQVRFTNQQFPLCRNFSIRDFRSKDQITSEGGLTARWQYICIYSTGYHREHNMFKERALVRINAREAAGPYAVLDCTRRFEWRGETIPGGAYRPRIDAEEVDWQQKVRQESNISIASSNPNPSEGILVCSPEPLMFAPNDSSPGSTLVHPCLTSVAGKRKHSSAFEPASRNDNQESRDTVEKARRQLSRLSIQIEEAYTRSPSVVIDLTNYLQTSGRTPSLAPVFELMGSGPTTPFEARRTPSLFPVIDLIDSDLATPPQTGHIPSTSFSPSIPVVRSPGQMLTYGDAFCGAGGTTRGAVMAGLRVKWGFDFSTHACNTWKANFPYASCHNLAADSFVQLAKRAEIAGFPDAMKVDILHLSPPCQYFSPAHTVNGVDDEMNVASLFAVQSVIEVSRPRVVTLEQTFGIMCPKFRFYFNALIQMFTIHDFSVRWAIIPLAQWVRSFVHYTSSLVYYPIMTKNQQGLPQRRNRLIIIGSWYVQTLPFPFPSMH